MARRRAREVPVLEVEDVSVSFSGRTILDGVSFEVRDGEFTGLIGSNGVGKTTLLRVILGLQRPDTGQVRVLGAPLSRSAADRSGTSPRRCCSIPTSRSARATSWPSASTRSATASGDARRHQRELVDQMLHDVDAERLRRRRVGTPLRR